MASENCTDLALTSEIDDLIEIHQLSGLPTKHDSRRTRGGFLIRADRLPGCIPLPSTKKLLRSWIWQYGAHVGYINDKQEVSK